MAQSQLAQKCPPAREPKRGAHGTFYWNELLTRDVERAKAFYAETIGWSYEAMPAAGGVPPAGRESCSRSSNRFEQLFPGNTGLGS